jgi:hypothetical protein
VPIEANENPGPNLFFVNVISNSYSVAFFDSRPVSARCAMGAGQNREEEVQEVE